MLIDVHVMSLELWSFKINANVLLQQYCQNAEIGYI